MKYIFEGEHPEEPYNARTTQKFMGRERQQAGKVKQMSFHSLHHSFVTHLPKKGMDIRYIKDLDTLGQTGTIKRNGKASDVYWKFHVH